MAQACRQLDSHDTRRPVASTSGVRSASTLAKLSRTNLVAVNAEIGGTRPLCSGSADVNSSPLARGVLVQAPNLDGPPTEACRRALWIT
jgi:hypothetical protein